MNCGDWTNYFREVWLNSKPIWFRTSCIDGMDSWLELEFLWFILAFWYILTSSSKYSTRSSMVHPYIHFILMTNINDRDRLIHTNYVSQISHGNTFKFCLVISIGELWDLHANTFQVSHKWEYVGTWIEDNLDPPSYLWK